VAQDGQDRTLAEHTADCRAREFENLVGGHAHNVPRASDMMMEA
jgi:hypothetical protein